MNSVSDQIGSYGAELKALLAFCFCIYSGRIDTVGLERLIEIRNRQALNLAVICDISEINYCANTPLEYKEGRTILLISQIMKHMRFARVGYIKSLKMEDTFGPEN